MGFDCAYISWGFCDGFSSRCLRVQRCETFWKFALFSPPCPPPKLCKNLHFFLLLHPYNTLDRSAGERCSVPLPPSIVLTPTPPLGVLAETVGDAMNKRCAPPACFCSRGSQPPSLLGPRRRDENWVGPPPGGVLSAKGGGVDGAVCWSCWLWLGREEEERG